MLDEPDPERQLRLNAHNGRIVKQRIGAVIEVIRAAAPADPDIGALWTRIQADFHKNQGAIVARLHEKSALHAGLDAGRATDILWTINHPSVWQLFVVERGWSPEQYERWCADTMCAQLLSRPASARR